MKRNNKKALYESIMMAVAKEVKKALNEKAELVLPLVNDDNNEIYDEATGNTIAEIWDDGTVEFKDELTSNQEELYKQAILANKALCYRYNITDESFVDEDDIVYCDRCGCKMIRDTEERYTNYGVLCDCCYGDLYD